MRCYRRDTGCNLTGMTFNSRTKKVSVGSKNAWKKHPLEADTSARRDGQSSQSRWRRADCIGKKKRTATPNPPEAPAAGPSGLSTAQKESEAAKGPALRPESPLTGLSSELGRDDFAPDAAAAIETEEELELNLGGRNVEQKKDAHQPVGGSIDHVDQPRYTPLDSGALFVMPNILLSPVLESRTRWERNLRDSTSCPIDI